MIDQAKHTPAPLEVAVMNFDDAVKQSSGKEIRAILDQNRAVVAIVFGTDLVSIPDANLFAASPDLFLAAKLQEKAESHWANCEECEGSASPELGCEKAFNLADEARCLRRAAIAKATPPPAVKTQKQPVSADYQAYLGGVDLRN